jgi:hypothetical protein
LRPSAAARCRRTPAAEVDAMVARETDRWARFVRESGLTLQ